MLVKNAILFWGIVHGNKPALHAGLWFLPTFEIAFYLFLAFVNLI
jgi:hypothetical protein